VVAMLYQNIDKSSLTVVDSDSSIGLVGGGTTGSIFDNLGFHCQFLLRPFGTKWPVPQI
jgi:hypothetical protein